MIQPGLCPGPRQRDELFGINNLLTDELYVFINRCEMGPLPPEQSQSIFLECCLPFVLLVKVLPYLFFLLRLRGGRQGAFDCELQFAISNSLRFPRLSALQLAYLICSLSPHFAPFTERCSFRRLQPPHAFFMPISCPQVPARLTILGSTVGSRHRVVCT